MLHSCQRKEITVIGIGKLDISEAYRPIMKANTYQKAVFFNFLTTFRLPSVDEFRLPNGGYDLSKAAEKFYKTKKIKNIKTPIILLTDLPFGETERGTEPGYFFFQSREDELEGISITIISTQPREALPQSRSYDEYLLLMLSNYIFHSIIRIEIHDELIGCLLDFCDELSDLEKAFSNCSLCLDCEQEIQKKIRTGQTTIEMVSAAYRLMYKAAKKKRCFIIIPFKPEFDEVCQTIKFALSDIGWTIFRADEISFPRLITSKVILEIMNADLVIADITSNNPNVFYEIGVTHMVGNDLLMITQEETIPFDIKNEQVIFYKPNLLDKLKEQLKKDFRKK